ncbi:LysR family transcriptional regulator [Gorillibacterium sp. sgz5001074]|uniref:LysR family transcriptional regulator n=1 Tax=Gorillibacterium sp. sgz5001074 TaxID=3446695 RepID=UPI003F674AD0
MDLTYFQTFREVALRGSFTKAAEELGYAQSSVTTQIQKLENAYGVQLFERYGKGLRLTAPGEELLRLAGRMLDLYDESMETVGSQTGGTLTIGTIDTLASYYLPPFLKRLRRRFPDLTVRLQPGPESKILEKVREGEQDVALLLDNGRPAEGALTCETLEQESLLLITPTDHPFVHRDAPPALSDLKDAVWVMPEESCNYRTMLERALKEGGIPCRIGFELGNPEAVKRCVRSGLGIAILPRMAVEDEIRRGELAGLAFPHPDVRLDLQLFVHPKKWMSKPLQTLIEWFRHGKIPDDEPAGFM